jgi:hypothetical protein
VVVLVLGFLAGRRPAKSWCEASRLYCCSRASSVSRSSSSP